MNEPLSKIPVPAVIAIVVIAILAVIFAVRRSSTGSGVPTPTGPPREAMEQMSKSAAGGVARPGGGAPGGMPTGK